MSTRFRLVLRWFVPAILIVATASCGGIEDYPAHDNEREPFFRRPYPNGTYIVTTFGGPGDSGAYGGKTACGPRVYGTAFYSTGQYGWGCNAKIRITANGKCAIVRVLDNGPAGWVETKAASRCGQGRILDVSPAVTKHLFGKSGYGWSDCKQISVERVSDSLAAGPCSGTGGSYTPTAVSGVGATCQIGASSGTCQDTNNSTCATGFKPDHCPGKKNVQCCLTGTPATGTPAPGTPATGTPATDTPATDTPATDTTAYGVGQSCQIGTYAGTCQDVYQASCTTGFKAGYCPGNDNVQCCLDGATSTSTVNGVGQACQVGSSSGVCLDTYVSSCARGFEAGHCPGPGHVQCCLDN